MARVVQLPARTAPSGLWLAASALLGRPVSVDEPYPHVCGWMYPGGERITRRGCAACAERLQTEGAA